MRVRMLGSSDIPAFWDIWQDTTYLYCFADCASRFRQVSIILAIQPSTLACKNVLFSTVLRTASLMIDSISALSKPALGMSMMLCCTKGSRRVLSWRSKNWTLLVWKLFHQNEPQRHLHEKRDRPALAVLPGVYHFSASERANEARRRRKARRKRKPSPLSFPLLRFVSRLYFRLPKLETLPLPLCLLPRYVSLFSQKRGLTKLVPSHEWQFKLKCIYLSLLFFAIRVIIR